MRTNNTTFEKRSKSIGLHIIAAICCLSLFLSLNGQTVSAAAKAPAAPKIAYASVQENRITLKWNKASRAEKYQVAVRSDSKSWKYYKTVRKTVANKNKYTNKNTYRVKASGTKYKVYRYIYTYQNLKTTTSTSYTYKAPERNKTYTLAVRSCNGKTSAWSIKSAKTWDEDTVLIDGDKHTHQWIAEYDEAGKLTGYTCSCNATKSTGGKVTEHVHSWGTRIKEKTVNKPVKCARTYYVCLECAARGVETKYPMKYYDSAEAFYSNPDVYHDHVEFDDNGNPCQEYYNVCPEATKHKREELQLGTRASCKNIDEEFTINKPTIITYTETYCTVCGAVK